MSDRHIDVPFEPETFGACPAVTEVLSRVGDKWSMQVVIRLGSGPRRFNELKRLVTGISQRMLTRTLRGLERDGLISRTVTPSVPPRVDYELTPLGHSLWSPVALLSSWAVTNREEIHQARDRYDAGERENNF
ncbi:winged helix-turn-helix transcriptional regulator [Altericroceibacterium spongiae]|uniref:winged helix-turn-helix transcriptional regulator n=1 Tax=Altericroceibacterium spongiae TaxID=2320269 RepID=UPI001EE575B9|nr:helix-turn-helix domain-containing protein [Altericroceibacterium spongiae]